MRFYFTLIAKKHLDQNGNPSEGRYDHAFNRTVKANSQLEAQFKIGKKWHILNVEPLSTLEIKNGNR